MNLSKWYEKLKRHYPRSTPYKFVYKTPGDLRKKTKRVAVSYFVYSESEGYEVFNIEIKRKEPKTVAQWLEYMKSEQPGEGEKNVGAGWHHILLTRVLPAASVRRGSELIFKDVLAWRNDIDIPTPVRSSKPASHKAERKRK